MLSTLETRYFHTRQSLEIATANTSVSFCQSSLDGRIGCCQQVYCQFLADSLVFAFDIRAAAYYVADTHYMFLIPAQCG